MDRKKVILGGVIATAVAILGASTASAHFDNTINKVQNLKISPEQREEIKHIIESKDYDAFKTHLEENNRTQMLEKITEEKFDKFLEMKELAISGDKDGARDIAEELGLERLEKRFHKGMHNQSQR